MSRGSAGAADPRERDDGLGWATRALFPDQRVWLRVGPAGSPPAQPRGCRVALRFVVAPSAGRARFLLPAAPRRVVAATVLAYNALRPPRVRAARAAVGALARLGATGLARMPLLVVAVPSGVDSREVLLVDRLAAQLGGQERGGPRLYAAVGVPTPDPNYKPTLQLFDHTGAPRGYAKVGWNRATRELVRAEHGALTAMAASAPAGEPDVGAAGACRPYVPRVLTTVESHGQMVMLVEPLPAGVRRLPAGAPPRVPDLLAVARRAGPAAGRQPFGGSGFAARLAAQAVTAAAPGPGAAAGERLRRAVRRLRQRDRDTTMEFGAWHGDWVPWNQGQLAGGRLAVWDWEHSGADVPVGFDLVHQGFQCALILKRLDAAAAAASAERLLARYGDRLGLDAGRRRLVLDAYLAELWLRTWRLARAGAGWNPALHPALLAVLEHRLEQR